MNTSKRFMLHVSRLAIRKSALCCAIIVAACIAGHDAQATNRFRVVRTAPAVKPATLGEPARPNAPAAEVTSASPGQGGYVHYFIITHPDGSLEYQLGIELENRRVAWSFPGVGVTVSPFVESGTIEVGGGAYPIQHLFGIRPFSDAARMHALQTELVSRVARFVDDETHYCVFRTPADPACLSCGDFVLRILFPGSTILTAALPKDYGRPIAGGGASTDDLLLYLLGLVEVPGNAARLKRINALGLPPVLREEAIRLVESIEADATQQSRPKPAAAPVRAAPAAKSAGKLANDRNTRRRL